MPNRLKMMQEGVGGISISPLTTPPHPHIPLEMSMAPWPKRRLWRMKRGSEAECRQWRMQ